MDNVAENRERYYRVISSDSLITQIILLNLLDALLTLYATGLGVGELNPLMVLLLSYGPATFLAIKVGLVTSLIIAINRFVGERGTRVYLLLSATYWLVTVWHVFGVLSLSGAI